MAVFQSYGQAKSESLKIAPAITEQSNLFKQMNGKERKEIFLKLQPTLITRVKTTSIENSIPTQTLTTRSEVYALLGQPDEILSPNLVAYKLSGKEQGCRAMVGIDKENNVIFSNIENCK